MKIRKRKGGDRLGLLLCVYEHDIEPFIRWFDRLLSQLTASLPTINCYLRQNGNLRLLRLLGSR